MKLSNLFLLFSLTLTLGVADAQQTTASAAVYSGFETKRLHYSGCLTFAYPLTNNRYNLHSEIRGEGAIIPQGRILKNYNEMGPIGKGVLVGAGVGIIIGGIVGAVSYEPCKPTGLLSCAFRPDSRGSSALIGAGIGLLGGIFWGSIVGVINKHQNR